MISKSALLFLDGFRIRRPVSEDGKGLGPPEHDEKGNNSWERITYCSTSSSHDHDLLLTLSLAFSIHGPPARFDCALLSLDVYPSRFLDNLEFSQGVQSWGVLNVTGSDIEAS